MFTHVTACRRERNHKQVLGNRKERRNIRSIRFHSLESSLWKSPQTFPKINYSMMMMMIMIYLKGYLL